MQNAPAMAECSAAETSTAEGPPASERLPREALSRALWGIDWNEHLPLDVGGGVQVHASTFDRSAPFVRAHYSSIFEETEDSPFKMLLSPHKERYYRLAGDFFEFKDGERTVGLIIGTPADWSTYYIRSAALLPDVQRTGAAFRFMQFLLPTLKSGGIERVEADASPSNFATIGILLKLSFNVTGTSLTDRWGAQIHLTRFLDDDSEDVFLRQFCSGVLHQRRHRSRAAP